MSRSSVYETVIVGGGQAGLSVGYHLTRQGRSFVILDGGERIGDSWRKRWDSLRLYSPAFRDALPGMAFPAPSRRTRRRTRWATTWRRTRAVRAAGAQRLGGGHADEGGRPLRRRHHRRRRFDADNVVIATGVFRKPYTPEFAGGLDPGITQLHSNDYRNPSQLQEGPVLVVGASHSGVGHRLRGRRDAHDWSSPASTPGRYPCRVDTRRGRMGFRVLAFAGRHILTWTRRWGERCGRMSVTAGHRCCATGGRISSPRGSSGVARTVGVDDGRPVLEDGRVLDVRNVVWCTGFRPDFSWIEAPFEIGDDGYPVQYRGAVAVGARPLLRRAALPALVHVDARLRRGQGRGARGRAPRVPTRASGVRRPGSSRGRDMREAPDTRADARSLLVWNGRVTRLVRKDAGATGVLVSVTCHGGGARRRSGGGSVPGRGHAADDGAARRDARVGAGDGRGRNGHDLARRGVPVVAQAPDGGPFVDRRVGPDGPRDEAADDRLGDHLALDAPSGAGGDGRAGRAGGRRPGSLPPRVRDVEDLPEQHQGPDEEDARADARRGRDRARRPLGGGVLLRRRHVERGRAGALARGPHTARRASACTSQRRRRRCRRSPARSPTGA